jgi:hypothetical protein
MFLSGLQYCYTNTIQYLPSPVYILYSMSYDNTQARCDVGPLLTHL